MCNQVFCHFPLPPVLIPVLKKQGCDEMEKPAVGWSARSFRILAGVFYFSRSMTFRAISRRPVSTSYFMISSTFPLLIPAG